MATLIELTSEEWEAKYGPILSPTTMFFVKEKPEWMKAAEEKQKKQQAKEAKKSQAEIKK